MLYVSNNGVAHSYNNKIIKKKYIYICVLPTFILILHPNKISSIMTESEHRTLFNIIHRFSN